ncbi:hypothetical protein PGT21_006399 [Puccinia graminis f. sp. tritici]|uniref:Uncharacterized protein n=1 Tax=Puccinia graminis f. sp. tritici TaxID=56615 RepID=A0A5B0S5T8_PUCGR|nr:hypothetical protein PGT21_006399 [Puccinia graminis f. sp. tritici]KAA1133566.1 hypothetical protein PGTUg99_024659 [Puccinia graminis f. sp. tritici]
MILEKGIFPPYRLNEFSRSPTFYTTNDAQQAFEHPLHTHPAYPPGSPVAVLQFDIPTAVIHGHFSPTNGEPPFRVKRFSLVEDLDDWRTFCRQNIDKNLGGYNHDYDIVIGPICVPSSKPFQTPLNSGSNHPGRILQSKVWQLAQQACYKDLH